MLRRPGRKAPGAPKLSEGCAAGQTLPAATLAAILELVERDAVARWWRGGRPVRVVERALIERIGQPSRRVATLDLGAGSLAPVAAMLSADVLGAGFAFAAACRPSLAEAAAAARRELAQSELSAAVARTRRDTGAAEACIDIDALIGALDPDARSDDLDSGRPEDDLAAIRRRAERQGVRFAIVDLTRRDLAVPVVKALSPELEPSVGRPGSALIRDHLARYGPLPQARARVKLF